VEALAEAQRRTEARLEALAEAQRRTEARVDALVEAQRRTEARLEALTARVDALAEAQQRTEARLEALAEEQRRLAEQVRVLTEGLQRLTDTVGGLKGWVLERIYAERAGAYFGRLLRRVRVVEVHTLEDMLETALTPEEFQDLLLLDLLVNGRVRRAPGEPEVWLAVEVSGVVDQSDVERAVRRAGLLRKAGYHAVPVVAGEGATQQGQEAAQAQQVAVVQDGQVVFWERAVAAWENLQLSS
ncbi:MAG: hypothetical protein NZT92_23950, partial [Abditibacteriales bacterium]|nr:hypothetical protein [Abditibacteriales bacterium]